MLGTPPLPWLLWAGNHILPFPFLSAAQTSGSETLSKGNSDINPASPTGAGCQGILSNNCFPSFVILLVLPHSFPSHFYSKANYKFSFENLLVFYLLNESIFRLSAVHPEQMRAASSFQKEVFSYYKEKMHRFSNVLVFIPHLPPSRRIFLKDTRC